jgi:hypothetical protein
VTAWRHEQPRAAFLQNCSADEYQPIESLPVLRSADSSMDLIFGISVLAHLDGGFQEREPARRGARRPRLGTSVR